MSDNPCNEPERAHAGSEELVPESGGPPAFQFSLASLFIVVTAVAVILSIFISVGQLFGMTTIEVLTQGLGQFLFSLPTFLVWIVGLTMAVRRLRRNRTPAILTMIAMGGLLLTTVVLHPLQMGLIHYANSGRIDHDVLPWAFGGIGLVYAAVNTIGWILILLAVFRHRPPDTSQNEGTRHSDEPIQAKLVDSHDDSRIE